jgi:hypothetical protein
MKSSDHIYPLNGIWIYSATSVNIPLTFSHENPPTITKNLAPGWNAIGHYGVLSRQARDELTSLGTTWKDLIGFDASTQVYETTIIRGASGTHSDTGVLCPTKGYWIFMNEGGVLEPPLSTPTPTLTPTPTPETFGAESNPTGNPLGGGAGYGQVYTENDTRVTYIVNTKDEFLGALAIANSGNVIYLPETANIDLTGVMGTSVPSGVTIAGNRGINGSAGGRIFQNRLPGDPDYGGPTRTMLNIVGDNVRITGLRLEGPDKTTSSLGESVRRGIYVNQYNNLEVDNCELWGWSWSAVHLADPTSTRTMYVHHNNIHHCQTDGYGYGVCVSGGTMLVEGNIFDYTRHAVASSGLVGESYETRYNLVGSHSTNHVFDVHEHTNPATGTLIAGRSYKIHHNTVEVTNQYAVVVRAVPVEGAWIDHNKFQWCTSYFMNYPPVVQANGVGNMYMTQNLIGTPGELYPDGPIRLL